MDMPRKKKTTKTYQITDDIHNVSDESRWIETSPGKKRMIPAGQPIDKYLDRNLRNLDKRPKGLVDRNCEVWEKDRKYVKSIKPKFVRTRSGKKIRYNPNTMG